MRLPDDLLENIVQFIDSYQTIENLLQIVNDYQKRIIMGSKIWIYNKPKKYTDIIHYNKYTCLHNLDLSGLIHQRQILNQFSATKIHTIRLNKNSNITNDDLKSIRYVNTLFLGSDSLITDPGIQNLKSIEILFLGNESKITDNGLQCLKSVRQLHLGTNSRITDNGLKEFFEQNPNLEKLNLGNNSLITDHGITFLKNIESLSLGDNSMITDTGIHDLVNLNPSINTLRIGENTKITLKSISVLTNILNVYLHCSQLETMCGSGEWRKLNEIFFCNGEQYFYVDNNNKLTRIGTGIVQITNRGSSRNTKIRKIYKNKYETQSRGRGIISLIVKEREPVKVLKNKQQSVRYNYDKHIKYHNKSFNKIQKN